MTLNFKNHTYWEIFDELIKLLKNDNKENIIVELEKAQEYVNGLTDGWFEFKFAFEKSFISNRQTMTEEQIEIAEFLITSLNQSLSNR